MIIMWIEAFSGAIILEDTDFNKIADKESETEGFHKSPNLRYQAIQNLLMYLYSLNLFLTKIMNLDGT